MESPMFSPPSPTEQYKLLVEDARALGDRRETINNLFVGVISLLAGGQAYIVISLSQNMLGLVVSLVATIFGIALCEAWRQVLSTYKVLLDFKYYTLKQWEQRFQFPSIQQYYVSEDILYDKKSPTTDLNKAMPQKWSGKAGAFVSLYRVLPRYARLVFIALALLQLIAFVMNPHGPLAPLHIPW